MRLPLLLPLLLLASVAHAQLPRDSSRVAVLLADGRLQLYSAFSDRVVKEFSLAPFTVDGPHQRIRQGANPHHLFLLLPPRARKSTVGSFLRLDYTTNEVQRLPLVDGTITFTAFAIGPRSGLVYLLGRDPDGIIVQTLDPATLAIRRQWRALSGPTSIDSFPPIRANLGHRWEPFFATIDSTERDLYVSFHAGTGGAERFPIEDTASPACDRRRYSGCIWQQHGTLLPGPSGLLMTTGSEWLMRVGANGAIDSINSGLEKNHVMWFTLDPAGTRAYVVGWCGYGAGLASVRLDAPGQVGRVMNPEVCGNTMAMSPSGEWLLVAAVNDPPYASSGPGRLTYVLAATGKELLTVSTPAPPIDVLILR